MIIALLLAALTFCSASAQTLPAIIPTPEHYRATGGRCSIDRLSNAIRYVECDTIAAEGYLIRVERRQTTVAYSNRNGRLYAAQTLAQIEQQWLLASRKRIDCFELYDRPRLGWRGFMLDSGRQYQSVDTVKRYLDMMAMLKMNRFHWHLTEGLGWRVEIGRYPLLTQAGSKVGSEREQHGYYTRQQIKEIVDYATERGIVVVPEIDMPGHAEAAIAAYPWLGCFGQIPEIPKTGFTPVILCAGKPSTLRFVFDVLDEVCELFPSEYIHLGGDEAPKQNWDRCPDCQSRIAELGLSGSHALQMWFMSQVADYLKAKGRKAIMWGDVVYDDGYTLSDNVMIQWWNWRGHKDTAYRNAVERGMEVIGSTNYYCYLNFPVTPASIYGTERTFDLEDVYCHNPSYNPSLEALAGIECALWADGGVTEELIDRRLFPRIFALSEQMWHTGALMPLEQFEQQIEAIAPLYRRAGYEFGPARRYLTPVDYRWF